MIYKNYGRGCSKSNIFNMLKIYEYFTDFQILQTVSAKLSWSHFIEIIKIENELN
ncbi:MAG: hypothetical protein J6M60_02370 [Clostridia bacterium]|nr:hypothetical protein [Clostridia bacterium]